MAFNITRHNPFTRQHAPAFVPGDYAQYDDGEHGLRVAVVQHECDSPFWGDTRRMIYVLGYFADGTRWTDYWPVSA